MDIYGRKTSSFEDGRKMRFFAHPNLAKSDKAKGSITKAFERQKFFLEAILQDHISDILHLDTIPEGSSFPTLRTMLLDIKSSTFTKISLFYLIDRTWDKMRHK